MKTFKKGFTLIELLIVIVIIGILAVGFAPTLLNAPKKARDGIRKGNLASIKDAIEGYALDHNSNYPLGDTVCIDKMTDADGNLNVIAPYFQGKTLPKDPSNTNCVDISVSGFHYRNFPIQKCYIIGAKLEEAGKGNSKEWFYSIGAEGGASCGTAINANGGTGYDFYMNIVKY